MANNNFVKIVNDYGNKVVRDIQREWDNLTTIDGETHISFNVSTDTNNNIVIGRLEASGQKAWIAEYGKGSLMDTEAYNPYLSRYKHNPKRWNRLRKGHFVTGRPKEPYTDLDGNVHYPSGKLAGRNLEATGIPDYKPSKPYHVIQNIVMGKNGLKEMFKEQLANEVKNLINIEVKRK